MGCGSFTTSSFSAYSHSVGRTYDTTTGRVSGQTYTSRSMDDKLNPKNVMRECCNTDEHPNTIPVILGLDVTGSMGGACKETALALGKIVSDLFEKFKDVQIMVMGIGDLSYDSAPIQISQFESDVRIAEWLDKIWLEKGGGGNNFESYTAAWYMGLYHTKLDAYDNQGRKGIIITMGDEPLNPYLPKDKLTAVTGDHLQSDVETSQLFKDASEKFHIFHIAVDDQENCYKRYKHNVDKSFKEVLGGQRFVISTIKNLGQTICDCVETAVNSSSLSSPVSENGEGISW